MVLIWLKAVVGCFGVGFGDLAVIVLTGWSQTPQGTLGVQHNGIYEDEFVLGGLVVKVSNGLVLLDVIGVGMFVALMVVEIGQQITLESHRSL